MTRFELSPHTVKSDPPVVTSAEKRTWTEDFMRTNHVNLSILGSGFIPKFCGCCRMLQGRPYANAESDELMVEVSRCDFTSSKVNKHDVKTEAANPTRKKENRVKRY
jgi:hypothetical protein